MTPRGIAAAALGAIALAAAACAPVTVNSYVEPGAELARYRTYDWAPRVDVATGDARLDNNPFFDAAVRQAVDERLRVAGLERTVARPDAELHYHTRVTQDLVPGSSDVPYAVCTDCRHEVYESGSLVIDVVDARTGRLLWRGWATQEVDGVVENQDWMERRVEQVVRRIFEHFPGMPGDARARS